MDVKMQPQREFQLNLPADHTALAYLFEGAARFGAETEADRIEAPKMVWLEQGDEIQVATGAGEAARFLLFAGAPFREPIYPYGPFVMNSKEEIEEAIHELRTGNFVKEGAGWKDG
jgi:redox-sensitive bicupin YhaK (pirin superfamily)